MQCSGLPHAGNVDVCVHNMVSLRQVPRCVDVTKQDCVTKWVVGVDGQKVWAGNEFCKPVTWRKCNLVTEPKIFNEAR